MQYSAVLQGALDNIQKYPHCVVITRVGGFYELYFTHAEELHRDLGLRRSYKITKLGPVAMAGFPWFQLDRYLKILVGEMGRNVAISDEFTRDAGPNGAGPVDLNNKNIFERRVNRIVTPGTLIDEKFMETETSNYLLSICRNASGAGSAFGLAWMDLSTGEFSVQEVQESALTSHVLRLQPKEIVTSLDGLDLVSEAVLTKVDSLDAPSESWNALLPGSEGSFTVLETIAGSTLLKYVSSNLPESNISTLPPTRRRESEVVELDGNALYSLEIRTSMREQSVKGSLFQTMRRTITKSGTRLLSEWLVSPITSIPILERRLDLVELLIEDEGLKSDILRFLKSSGDAVRVLQRFGFGRGEVDDLLTITRAITATSELLAVLSRYDKAASLTSRMEVLDSLRKKIVSSIDEDGLMKRNRENAESAAAMMEDVLSALNNPSKPIERRRKAIEREMTYTMKPGATSTLRQLHKSLANMSTEKEELEIELRSQTGMQSLTLRTLPGLSHIVHVKGADTKLDLSQSSLDLKQVGSTRSTKSFHLAAWSFLGTRIESEKIRIAQEETRTFSNLRKEVLKQSSQLRANAKVLDELDVSACFATLASENNWIRPALTESPITHIINGRHPVVEQSLTRRGLNFTPNSLHFDSTTRMYLVTGTNMGGKSTFLRQFAILQILAQCGSYIPASSATMGLVDGIYSRLGANDNLPQGQSTFMCEMSETAQILKRAGGRSLVILDEVGRGTTARDGMGIGFGVVNALSGIGCRVLFATHFHELADFVESEKSRHRNGETFSSAGAGAGLEKVGMLCTELLQLPNADPDPDSDSDAHREKEQTDEEGENGELGGGGESIGSFTFSHQIKTGICRDSHGLKVATLAGIPEPVVRDALAMQKSMESRGSTE